MNEPTRFVNKKRLNNQTFKANEEENSKLEACKTVDLDEIFQFSAARQRALERNEKIEYERKLKNFMPNRVFINHVDSFNGRVIADYLSEQTIDVLKSESLSAEDEEHAEEGMTVSELTEEDGEDFSREKELQKEKGATSRNFEIIGTVDFMKTPDYKRPEGITEILDEEAKEEFLSKILTCGFIIYDISSTLHCHPVQIEEATWILDNIVYQLDDIQRNAPRSFKNCKDRRTFILISTLMTWAKTKPIDPNDPNLPLLERDYRKRKPHPNYKIHCDFEKRVLEIGKKYPRHLKTIVIGSGVTYGRGEDVLHFLFKMAWLNSPELPLFKPGNNKIPLIHISALANIVHQILEDFPASVKYIVAVEQSPTTLKQIVKLISKKLGSGKYVKVSKEEAFTYKEIKQRNFDMLTVDINIIPGYVMNNMELKDTSELTFVENIDTVIAEFREGRNLKPIKIYIHGPPAAGKSLLSKRLSDYYKIHHLHVKEVIENGIKDLKDRIEEIKKKERGEAVKGMQELDEDADERSEVDEEDAEDNDDTEDLEALNQFLNDIEDNMASNERNRLDEQFVLRLFRRRMLSNPCQNQGFVIDGYPKTIEDTKILYEPDEEEDEEGGGERDTENADITKFYNKKIMPATEVAVLGWNGLMAFQCISMGKIILRCELFDMRDFVGSLDASDEFLIQKVIKMPESQVQNTHWEEGEMCRRLVQFRDFNTEENTPLIFYDELDLAPRIYNIQDGNDDLELNFTFKDIIRQIGPPRNYAPSPSEKLRKEEKEKIEQKNLKDVTLKSRQTTQERREKMENWMFLKNQEKEMEEKALALLAMPLRHYLMKYIFPTLTRGLVEVARIRPKDPVDYLAEYLFKENPEGKMFHPNYDNLEEELMSAMKDYDLSLNGQDNDSERNIPKSFSADDSVMPDAVSNVTDVKAKCSALSMSSKRTLEAKKELIGDARGDAGGVASTGSCKCIRSPSRISKVSSTSSSSTPSIPPSACTCPPYFNSASSESKTSSSDSSPNSCSKDPISLCRCPH